jgi:heme-degrading monooxygenase HmoA
LIAQDREGQSMIAETPSPPYYAVIFSSIRSGNNEGYNQMAEHMMQLARGIDGFLGVESVRQELGITISYWRDLESIDRWRNHPEHLKAKELGREVWYEAYHLRIARVEEIGMTFLKRCHTKCHT